MVIVSDVKMVKSGVKILDVIHSVRIVFLTERQIILVI